MICLEKYLGEETSIDCPDIRIYQWKSNDENNQQEVLFQGPGEIRLSSDGYISYRIYAQNMIKSRQIPYGCILLGMGHGKEVLPCIMEAVDYSGNKWSGGWTEPSFSFLSAKPQPLVRGKIKHLCTDQKSGHNQITNVNEVELYFMNAVMLPYDQIEKTTIQINGDPYEYSYQLTGKEIHSENFHIRFLNNSRKNFLKITASGKAPFQDPCLENWIVEALMMSSGVVQFPRIIIRHVKGHDLIFIRAVNSIQNKPSRFSIFLFEGKNEFWTFFQQYIYYRSKQNNDIEYLDMTKSFLEVILTNGDTLRNQISCMSQCVEFLTKLIPLDTQKEKNDVKKIQKYVMDCLQEHQVSRDMQERTNGLLSMLNQPSIHQILKRLVERNIITKEQKCVWEKQRPKIAHGGGIQREEDVDFDDSRILICLIYRLISNIISYTGKIPDYQRLDHQFSFKPQIS